ncbi:MAG: hypothetical protein WBL63_15730 [Candidatus Acidiferrum sp.]
MIYLGNDPEEGKKHRLRRRKADHIVTLSNAAAEVQRSKKHYTAAVVDTVTREVAKNVSALRRAINTATRHDRRS